MIRCYALTANFVSHPPLLNGQFLAAMALFIINFQACVERQLQTLSNKATNKKSYFSVLLERIGHLPVLEK